MNNGRGRALETPRHTATRRHRQTRPKKTRPTSSAKKPPLPLPARRMLQLLHQRKIKRIVLMSDGRTAIVEVPVENTESDFMTATYDRRDLTCVMRRQCCCCCRCRCLPLPLPATAAAAGCKCCIWGSCCCALLLRAALAVGGALLGVLTQPWLLDGASPWCHSGCHLVSAFISVSAGLTWRLGLPKARP